MERSRVYFTNLRTTPDRNILQKLDKLVRCAGIGDIDFIKQYAAIKLHLGEPGNLAYLRPNFSKVVADMIKELGGKPFLTDCNTLYAGRRKDALEHLDSAYENGYNPFCTGCQVIIADGLKGSDESIVPVPGGEFVKEARIGRAVMDADIIISMTHFKGHEQSGFGGSIKNIGMGSGSRAGKMEMHSTGKLKVKPSRCRSCRKCISGCAHDAITFDGNGKAVIEKLKCVGCGRCLSLCSFDAISPTDYESNETMCRKMAEYAKAVLNGRPQFHISFVIDVSPFCDCHVENDLPVVSDVGIFASKDPVALDQACAEAVMKAPVVSGSILEEKIKGCKKEDHFHTIHPDTHWQTTLEHCEKLGIGTRIYELIEV